MAFLEVLRIPMQPGEDLQYNLDYAYLADEWLTADPIASVALVAAVVGISVTLGTVAGLIVPIRLDTMASTDSTTIRVRVRITSVAGRDEIQDLDVRIAAPALAV